MRGLRVLPIASSSKGNAYVVEEDGQALLIVCGVNKKFKLGLDNPKVEEFQAWIDNSQK